MNATQAQAELSLDLQPAAPPALSNDEQAVLLAMMAIPDSAGVAPDGNGWVPTYDPALLTRAVYRGLQAKAAKVAGKLTYTADGQTYQAGELADQLGRQLQRVATRLNGSAGGPVITHRPVRADGLPADPDDDESIGVTP